MFRQGLIDEIRRLRAQHGELSRTASQAVGYREVLEAETTAVAVETVMEEVAAHTRQLARRQETWFRSFSEIRPIAVREPIDPETIAAEIASMLGAVG